MIPLSLVLVVASAATLAWGIAASSQQLVWVSLAAALAAVALVATTVVRIRRRLAVGDDGAAPGSEGSEGSPAAAPPPPAAWPWSADVPGTGSVPPPRSGWTGPVAAGPPAMPEATPEAAEAAEASEALEAAEAAEAGRPAPPSAVEQSAASPPARPAQPARSGAEQDAAGALGAPADRPLDESFPAEDGEPPVEDVPVRDALRVAQLDDEVQVVDGHPRYHLTGCPALAGAEPVPLPVSAARRAGFTPCAACGPDRTLLARALDRRSQASD